MSYFLLKTKLPPKSPNQRPGKVMSFTINNAGTLYRFKYKNILNHLSLLSCHANISAGTRTFQHELPRASKVKLFITSQTIIPAGFNIKRL